MKKYIASTILRSPLPLFAILLGWSCLAHAQQTTVPASPDVTTAPTWTEEDTRPATTTFFGDTGLWYVPTAEVLRHGQWSASGYRRGTNYIQGYTNVGDFAGTFAVGVRDRVEVFGSFLVDTRIDRDTQPLFFADSNIGGIVDRYPNVTRRWSGNNLGDFYVGGKVSLLSEFRQSPFALAMRGMIKLPTGDEDAGVSTGRTDTIIDAIASRELGRAVEISGFAGYEFRGVPDGFDLPKAAFRWGAGAAFPTRFPLRGFAELSGVRPSSDIATITSTLVTGPDGSQPPTLSNIEKLTRLTFGMTYQARNGFFIGGGLSRNMPTQERNDTLASEGSSTDYTDWQLRIGFHPGQRARPMPARVPASASAAPTPAPRPGTLAVKAACDPCLVDVNMMATVTAVTTASTACTATYVWAAPAGALTTPSSRTTPWRAPGDPGTVPVTVTATCLAEGLTASDTVNVQVVRPTANALAFDDVYFDYDEATLSESAAQVLDRAVLAMQTNTTFRLTIEGNTCSIGTAESNLALGSRRANTVRDYLISQGIDGNRLFTVSFGEERPTFDNEREDTRRMNRRASLVAETRQSARLP